MNAVSAPGSVAAYQEFARSIVELRARHHRGCIVLRRHPSSHVLARKLVAEYRHDQSPLPEIDIVAHEQTDGLGRKGDHWQSPAGAGAWVSLLRRVEATRAPLLPMTVAVALAEALDPWLGERCRLKWPNDLMVGERKLGGILIDVNYQGGGDQGSSDQDGSPRGGARQGGDRQGGDCQSGSHQGGGWARAVLSFGVNLTTPRGVPLPATSLSDQHDRPPGLAELIDALAGSVDRALAAVSPATVAEYRQRSAHADGDHLTCRQNDNSVSGRFVGFDDQGCLQLEVDGTTQRLCVGELIAEAR